MTAQSVLLLYILFFAAEFLFENTLTLLNLSHVRKNSGSIPPRFRDFIDRENYERQTAYSLDRGRFALVSSICSSALVLVVVLTGLLGIVETWVLGLGLPRYIGGIAVIFIISLIFRFFGIPFSLYSQFVLEEKYGFNKMTGKLFILDFLKSLVLSAVLAFILLYSLFWFIDSAGSFWWLYAFLFIAAFQLILSVLYPLIIAPLFNKFSPLEEGSLRSKLLALAEKLSFRTKGIYVMDGSRRSKHSNAYFTGIGKTKRIVLFDTLITAMGEEQVVSVLAHEIGHEKKKHVIKRMIISLVLLFTGFFVIQLLLDAAPLFQAFGLAGPSSYGIFIILSFCASPFTFVLTPLFTAWSRKHEYEADRFAVDAVGGYEDMKKALISLSKENLSTLTPHPLYSFYHYSHPTLGERIEAMSSPKKRLS